MSSLTVAATSRLMAMRVWEGMATRDGRSRMMAAVGATFCSRTANYNTIFLRLRINITTFAVMMKMYRIIGMVCLMVAAITADAQTAKRAGINPEDRQVDMDNPTFVPMVKVGKALVDGDSIQYVELNNVYVYPEPTFKNDKQRAAYNRLVYNVKKVLPIAKEVNKIIIETYEYLQTLPNKKARDEHMKRVEAEIKKQYTPRMKKLSYSQGKLLIKLVYRECNSSAYDLIRAFINPIRAGFYQAFAWTFGASLTKKYDPEKTDRLTERVVLMVESGQL